MLFENRSGRNPKEVQLTPNIENVENDFWKLEVEIRRWVYIINERNNIANHKEMEKELSERTMKEKTEELQSV